MRTRSYKELQEPAPEKELTAPWTPRTPFVLTLWELPGRWPTYRRDENLPRRVVGRVNFDRWLLPR